jgi:hypothetical protein
MGWLKAIMAEHGRIYEKVKRKLILPFEGSSLHGQGMVA